MDPVIDELFKIERTAQEMESEVDVKKEALRKEYKQKQQDFDRENDQQTKNQLERIREESKQQQEEKNKKILAQYKTEVDRLETVYSQKQDRIIQNIFTNIIKG